MRLVDEVTACGNPQSSLVAFCRIRYRSASARLPSLTKSHARFSSETTDSNFVVIDLGVLTTKVGSTSKKSPGGTQNPGCVQSSRCDTSKRPTRSAIDPDRVFRLHAMLVGIGARKTKAKGWRCTTVLRAGQSANAATVSFGVFEYHLRGE